MADKPPLIYWDANVFLSYVDGDQDRIPDIDEFFRKARAGEVEIVTSTLSIVEVAFGSEEKTGRALDAETRNAIDELWKPGGAVTLVEFFPLVALDARGLIRTAMTRGWSLKAADAIHLATAMRQSVSAIHTYESGWRKYSPDIGCPISEPQHPQLTFPPTTPDVS
jgi:predicted nucleic acid-binding protein